MGWLDGKAVNREQRTVVIKVREKQTTYCN